MSVDVLFCGEWVIVRRLGEMGMYIIMRDGVNGKDGVNGRDGIHGIHGNACDGVHEGID